MSPSNTVVRVIVRGVRFVRIIGSILALFSSRVQRLAVHVGLVAGLLSCASGREEFVDDRVADRCAESWPVCDQLVGCLLGNRSYLEGRFPGTARFGVVLEEPSSVRVSVFLEEVRSEGTETVFTFHEDGCRDRQRLPVSGRLFVEQAEREGAFTQEAELFGVGEHLLEVQSDAQTAYVLKVELIPKRGQ